jgi:cysteinyl-tRNA synthetase
LRAAEKLHLLLRFDEVFGLDLGRAGKDTLDDELLSLIARRHEARRMRDWATADALRAELLERGIKIKDRADGTNWERLD